MKFLFAFLPAFCLFLSACESPEQEGEKPAETDTPATQSESPDETAGAPAAPDDQTAPDDQGPTGADAMATEYAEAEILPTEGEDTGGLIKLTSAKGEVAIEGTITGLEPGAHGFHIHEKGDCSAPDASSAGDHFEPADDPHGAPEDLPAEHHVGDLGNVTAGENGEAEVNVTDAEIKMSGPNSVIGKAVIVHAGQDDFETQPSGDSGARVGCGVIRALEVAESSSTTV